MRRLYFYTHVWATIRFRPYRQSNSADAFPNNYALCIMNCELSTRPQGFASTVKINFADVFPNNYAL